MDEFFVNVSGRPRSVPMGLPMSSSLRSSMGRAAGALLVDEVLDRLPCQAAVVDRGGNLVMVNEAWRDFAETHPRDPRSCALGNDFRLECERRGFAHVGLALGRLLATGEGIVAEDIGSRTPGPRFRLTARLLPRHHGAVITCWELPASEGSAEAGASPLAGTAAWAEVHDRLTELVVSAEDPSGTALAIIGLEPDGSTDRPLPGDVSAAVAERIQRACRPGDLVTSSGPDELCVLLTGVLGEIHAIGIAERLLDVVLAPLLVDDGVVELAGHVGVVSASRLVPLRDPETTIASARIQASQHELRRRPRHASHTATVTALDRALAEEEFVLHYQPVFAIADRRLVGVEALIRWQHPSRGLVPPDGFIPLAEQTGRIAAIGAWALHRACTDARLLDDDLEVSVNISANQLPAHFDALVHATLERTRLAPHRLCLEITESLVMADPDLAAAVLGRLTRHGIRVALDDFGTGYSSLARLRDLALQRIKVDRSFVRDLEASPLDQKIVAAIIQLGHTLEVEVVAEGVETEGQLELLAGLGCDHVQGYLLGRPVPLEDLAGSAAVGAGSDEVEAVMVGAEARALHDPRQRHLE